MNISEKPLICCICLEKLQKCVLFKAICNAVSEKKLDTGQLLNPNMNLCLLCSNNIKSDLSNIEINENKLIEVTLLGKYVPAVITSIFNWKIH